MSIIANTCTAIICIKSRYSLQFVVVSSMTSVPKPMKPLRPHYQEIVSVYEKYEEGEIKVWNSPEISVFIITALPNTEL